MNAGPQFIDLPTAAERSGKSVGHLGRRCREEWKSTGLAVLRKSEASGQRSGKAEWFVREDADAALARVKSSEQVGADLSGLSEKKRREAFARLDVLKRWDQALSGRHQLGLTEAVATHEFIQTIQALDGRPLSRRTLYNWRGRYRKGGILALADQRGNAAPSDQRGSAEADFLDSIKRLWLDLRRPTLRSCYAIAAYEHRRSLPSFVAPSYSTVHRFVRAIPKPVIDKYRGGDKLFTDGSAPFLERDYSALHTNETWCGDHHQFDVVINHNGQLLRPWLTAWEDMRSRVIVGWRIFPHAPNADTILLALRAGIDARGVPEGTLIDNGRDYLAWALNGRTRADRWRGTRVRIDYDAPYLGGLFESLGIAVTHCQPYHGQSKPIERFFGTLESQFGKTWATYCGNKPAERPEDLQAQIERGNAPSLDTFAEAFASWLATYHAARHTGDAMDGRSPDEVYAASWNGHSKRVCSEDLLWWLTLKPQHPTKVGQLGVRCNGLHYGALEPKLFEYRGREVLVRHDPAIVNAVFVCDLEGKPICVAAANQRLPANASSQELREAQAGLKADRRRVRDYLDRRPRIAADPVDRMITARADASRAQQRDASPDLPAMKPVRSTFEAEISDLKSQIEAPLKSRGGDGPNPDDCRFTYVRREDAGPCDREEQTSFAFASEREVQR
jgi:hypothetical protein